MSPAPPVALTIAGSDCSGGAGIQADLKTFQHFRIHGLTAVTCVVSETANLVRTVFPVPADVVADQVSLMLDTFPVAAIKTGMLFSAGHVLAVAEILRPYPGIPLVVDPVMIASTGTSLLEEDAIAAYREALLPLATLITPNLPEAETLLGRRISSRDQLENAALELSTLFKTAVLLKGGHLDGDECIDLLAVNSATRRFSAPRIDTAASHGTGCTLSAAVTALLARGDVLTDAVGTAKMFLGDTLLRSYQLAGPDGKNIHVLNQGTTLDRSPII